MAAFPYLALPPHKALIPLIFAAPRQESFPRKQPHRNRTKTFLEEQSGFVADHHPYVVEQGDSLMRRLHIRFKLTSVSVFIRATGPPYIHTTHQIAWDYSRLLISLPSNT